MDSIEIDSAVLIRSWLDRDTMPRIVINEVLRLEWANRAARSELDRRQDLEIRNGHLASTNPDNQARLASCVRETGTQLYTFSFASEHGDGHVLFRAIELENAASGRFFGLSFYRSGSDFKAYYADVESIFELTQSEHRVLLQLLDGRTADEIARHLRVSIETTRSHIRQIYLKLDVTSREGMFSRIQPYRVF